MDAVLNREDVTLPGEIAAWLYNPDAEACVVMGHGLSAVRDQRLPAYAERYAAEGLAVLLFDYRGFGASGGEPRQVIDIGAQLDDWRTAIRYARDFKRVGLMGSSFAGGHVIQLAATEDGIAAAVAQCPMTDGLLASLMTPPKTALKLTRAALQDQARALAGKPPKLIKAAGLPGELALMTTPDTVPGMESITPPDSLWVNAVAARVGLKIPLYRPGRLASRVACPLLICLCDRDALVSVKATEKVAEQAPQAELARYPIGHFEIYTGEWFERAVSRQAEFLARHLSGSSPS
ncbi:MAG TPA: alpha/beta hydrolase [Solirubrobacter sp.]|nr:alpha/beta hydrolase [Solirubrobacter sp.]